MTRALVVAQLWCGFSAARSSAGPRGVARRSAAHGYDQCGGRVGWQARGTTAVGEGGVGCSVGLGPDRAPGTE
uniref:Secreted protein n=1 Tax=Oryza rufipogon TaxID=4529 RepID=A0A0E0RHH9_ORYRU